MRTRPFDFAGQGAHSRCLLPEHCSPGETSSRSDVQQSCPAGSSPSEREVPTGNRGENSLRAFSASAHCPSRPLSTRTVLPCRAKGQQAQRHDTACNMCSASRGYETDLTEQAREVSGHHSPPIRTLERSDTDCRVEEGRLASPEPKGTHNDTVFRASGPIAKASLPP